MEITSSHVYFFISYAVAFLACGLVGGFALLFALARTLKLLFSNRDYGEVFPRLAGMLMSGLGMSIAGIIRARAQALYPATLAVRLYFIACLVPLYRVSRDPFFLVVLGVVAVGVAFTLMSYLADRATRG